MSNPRSEVLGRSPRSDLRHFRGQLRDQRLHTSLMNLTLSHCLDLASHETLLEEQDNAPPQRQRVEASGASGTEALTSPRRSTQSPKERGAFVRGGAYHMSMRAPKKKNAFL